MFKHDINSLDLDLEFFPPLTCSISTGSSKSKTKSQSSSESGTRWNQDFLRQLKEGGPQIDYSNDQDGVTVAGNADRPEFTLGVPKFQGLEDMDYQKLEKGLYDRQVQNTEPQYQKARAQTREELSQAGLLNSPVQYSSGGAIDNLTQAYLAENRKAATDASNKTIELKQQELARKTGFDIDMVKLFQTIMAQYADTALRAGQFGQSQSASKGTGDSSNFGVFTFGPSNTSTTTNTGSSNP